VQLHELQNYARPRVNNKSKHIQTEASAHTQTAVRSFRGVMAVFAAGLRMGRSLAHLNERRDGLARVLFRKKVGAVEAKVGLRGGTFGKNRESELALINADSEKRTEPRGVGCERAETVIAQGTRT
jgi:hypothetical protein